MFPKVATALLDAGADPNLADYEGLTPLKKAVWLGSETSGCRRVIKVLLERGADPNVAQRNGRTPMHTVACEGDEDLAKLLMDYGANPFVRDDRGRTAFKRPNRPRVCVPLKTSYIPVFLYNYYHKSSKTKHEANQPHSIEEKGEEIEETTMPKIITLTFCLTE